jgi:lipopolysaccharide transport system ATP-binding protein
LAIIEPYIQINNLTLQFEIYDQNSQSLKKTIIQNSIGGIFNKKEGKRIIIKSLNNINLQIKSGDRVGLIGNNGSGKSSLLNLISGIYRQTSGNLNVKGSIVSILDLNHGLDFDATGYENILLRGILNGHKPSEIKKNLKEIIEFSELGHFINIPIKNYSMGMILRLAFASSTFYQPQILLLDEWLSVGDQTFIKKCEKKLDEMIKSSQILILASHDLNLIHRVCNKIVKLEAGSIIEVKSINS